MCAHLHSHMQLGCAFGWTRSLKSLAIHFDSHCENWNVNWAGLGYQLVLETRLELIEPHQSVHSLGRLSLLLRSW